MQASPASFKSHKLLAYALHESDAEHANIDAVIEEAEKGLAPLNALPDSRNNADSYLRTGGYYAERGERLRQSSTQRRAPRHTGAPWNCYCGAGRWRRRRRMANPIRRGSRP